METPELQRAEELDDFYSEPDPWGYDSTPDDAARVARLRAALPRRDFRRTLDIGCGNGFLTVALPGREVVGCDPSEQALHWARRRVGARGDAGRFAWVRAGVFDLDAGELGQFDLIVITGVLYPQYIGEAFALARERVLPLLATGGVLATVHIDDWFPHRFPLTQLSTSVDPYREFTHRTEILLG